MGKPDLNETEILRAAMRFRDEFGKFPSANSGDASDYFDHPETWAAVNLALTKGNRGLAGGTSLSKLLRRSRRETNNMEHTDLRAIFTSIDGGLSRKPREVELLAALAERPDSWKEVQAIERELREKFGYRWRPLNGPDNNVAMLNTVNNPLAAHKEPITNGKESLNDLVFHGLQKPKSDLGPIQLSEECGFTETVLSSHPQVKGSEDDWAFVTDKAKDMLVSYLDGDHGRITYEILDRGTGIVPERALSTILELGGTNKTNKKRNRRYQGQHGMGGTTCIRFVSGSVYTSYATHTYEFDGTRSKKHKVKEPRVWTTVVEIVQLEDDVRRVCCLVNAEGEVPTLDPSEVQEKIPGSILEDMAEKVGDALKKDTPKEVLHAKVAEVHKAGGPQWRRQPIERGTRVTHYNFNLSGFNRADVRKNEMRRILATYFTRVLHPLTYFECRDLNFFNHNWKFQRTRAVFTGLRGYLENSPVVVLGKGGTGHIKNVEFETESGVRESVDVRVWVLKRQNEALGGVEATRENYEAENRVRDYLKLSEKESLPTFRLEEAASEIEEALETKKMSRQSRAERAKILNDVKNVLKGRRSDGAPPIEGQIIQKRALLFTLSGCTHDARTSTRFWQDCKMSAMDHRAIVEVELDGLSDMTRAEIIDSRRESMATYNDTYKALYSAVVAAVSSNDDLKLLYQEIRDMSDNSLGDRDEDLVKRVNELVDLIEVEPRTTKKKRDERTPYPLGTSDTLRKIEIVADEDDVVWLYKGSGKKAVNRRLKLLVASDAPDGFHLDHDSTMIVLQGGRARLSSFTPFHEGYATLTVEWDGLEHEDEGGIHITTKVFTTGEVVTSGAKIYKVAKPGTGGGKGTNNKGTKPGSPEITPRPISRSEWEAPPMGPFDENTIAAIEDLGDSKYVVYVNIDNVVFNQQMDRRHYSSAHRERLRREYATWMSAFLYGLEYGKLGYYRRTAEDGFSETERTEADRAADYRHAMGMFMGLKFRAGGDEAEE